MENKNHVFTKSGYSGYTKLYDGTSVDKDNIFIEANGNFDELTSHIGIIKANMEDKIIVNQLDKIQNRLIKIMGVIAGLIYDKDEVKNELTELEMWIINYESKYPTQKKFILPGKSSLSAQIDVTRTVCRRSERSFIKCYKERQIDNSYLKYINRLSDYFHVLARYIEFINLITDNVNAVLNNINIKNEVTMNSIDLSKAKKLIEKVESKAKEIGINVVIAVSNNQGNPIAVNVMDDAYIASYDIALNKAFTSVSLKMTTEELGELAKPNGSLYGIQFTNNGRIVIFGGGTPLIHNGEIIGGLGVSGGSAKQDTFLANYGAEVMKILL
jgi:ATP:cob(I)alamin adenosyltransferase